MKIGELFEKQIDRQIQGVVKIGQDNLEIIKQELEEYVVTKELNKHFNRLFENYRKGVQQRTDEMGVWISGFFGSGKSHFLKILSYLLSNDKYEGKKAIDFFDKKIADARIMADMQVASNTSADVVLFNIDAEADADSKINKDAIVKVFMKMFNKMQGYCGSMPWIADLERQMDKDGVYDTFCVRFKELSGSDWIEKREDYYFEEDNIIEALADSTKMSKEAAINWYDRAEKNYTIDINAFARKVREYIEAKTKKLGKKHFIIFLCDEIGQYIGSDSGLMLNLQSLVESLGNECGGQAWVIATSQEDIDKITKVDRDNFSKIIGRFNTKLSLSSANVDEVIKKRLLAKTKTASDKLRLVYVDKSAVLKNLITFSHDTPEKRTYASAEDFISIYPFVPYQFNLLQAVFNGIRTHGAAGAHLAEGERSLLNAFQEAAIQYQSFEDGILIPFDAFYKTVEAFLDHNIRKVISDAEDSAERTDGALQPYDVEVLKVLFMVKYIPDRLPTNLENITTVMLQNIDQDKIEAKKKVDASLRRLDEQKLIIKNGDQFIFLTNEEQDINREIREIHIEHSIVADKAGDIIFDILFGINKKYQYGGRYNFSLNTIIDDRPRGAQREEIGIRVLTPLNTNIASTDSELKSLSMRERNVIMMLADDRAFFDEVEQSLQIDTFIRRSAGKTLIATVEDIKTTKIRESKQRMDRARELLIEGLKRSDIYVNGLRWDIRENEPSERVKEALQALVESIYTKLNYIDKPFHTNESLQEILIDNGTQTTLSGVDVKEPNHLAIIEMTDVVTRHSNRNVPFTMRAARELFRKIPYGWEDMDIAGIVLTLFKKQEIRLDLSGETLSTSNANLINYVTKRDYLDRVVMKTRIKVSGIMLSNAKELAHEVFNRSDVPNDEDGLMEKLSDLSEKELDRHDPQNPGIKQLLDEYDKALYPGKTVLETGEKLLTQLLRIKDIVTFFEYLNENKEAFIDYADDVQDVKKFFKNQREAFDKALKMLTIFENNRSYVIDPTTKGIVAKMEEITRLSSPYSQIHKLPELIAKFMKLFHEIVIKERSPVEEAVKADREAVYHEMQTRKSEKALDELYGETIHEIYHELIDRLMHFNNVYEVIAMRTESDRVKLDFIQKFDKYEAEQAEPKDDTVDAPPSAPVHRTKTISVRTLIPNSKQLTSKDDIEVFVGEIRTKLESAMGNDTTIRIV